MKLSVTGRIGVDIASNVHAVLQAVKNDQKNGVLMDLKGGFSGKPRWTNPYVAWAPGEQRGFRGFILILGKFFLLVRIFFIATSLETFLTDQKNP